MKEQIKENPLILKLNVNYHHAHVINFGQKLSTIKITNQEQGIVEIEEDLMTKAPILVKFALGGIKFLLNPDITKHPQCDQRIEAIDNFTFEVDTYSGAVAIKYTVSRLIPSLSARHAFNRVHDDPYIYKEKIGYSQYEKAYPHDSRDFDHGIIAYKPVHEFGYIMESPPRLELLLFKGLAFVENLQKGILKLRTSSFDLNGYVVQLFPKAILDITRSVDEVKTSLLESKEESIEVKEVQEAAKEESYRLVERNPLDLGSLSLVSDLNENEASVEALGDCQEYAQ